MEINKFSKNSTKEEKILKIIIQFGDIKSKVTSSLLRMKILKEDKNVKNLISCIKSFWNVEIFLHKFEYPITIMKIYDKRIIFTNIIEFIKKYKEKSFFSQSLLLIVLIIK